MTIRRTRVRQLHRTLAPIMFLPLLLSLTTGSLYQIAALAGKDSEFQWLLELHIGNFGILNLEAIYPFLNALGLVALALLGISLWLQTRRTPRRRPEEI